MEIRGDVSVCAADGKAKRLVLRSLGARGIAAHVKAVLWREIQRESVQERTRGSEEVEEVARRLLKTRGTYSVIIVIVVSEPFKYARFRCSVKERSVSRNFEVSYDYGSEQHLI